MCNSDADVISKFKDTVAVGEASITATDTMTKKLLVLEFLGPGSSVCVGSEIAGERHFFFPKRYYKDMLSALLGNKTIGIQGVEGPAKSFTKVSWETV